MSNAAKEAMELMEILPESEQNFALEMLKKIVIKLLNIPFKRLQ